MLRYRLECLFSTTLLLGAIPSFGPETWNKRGAIYDKADSVLSMMSVVNGRAVQADPRLTPGRPRLISALEPKL